MKEGYGSTKYSGRTKLNVGIWQNKLELKIKNAY